MTSYKDIFCLKNGARKGEVKLNLNFQVKLNGLIFCLFVLWVWYGFSAFKLFSISTM